MTITVNGLGDLAAFMGALPDVLSKRLLGGALRDGLTVIADDAKERVSVVSGEVRDSIEVSVTASKSKVEGSVDVHDYKANWLENGTDAHLIKARGEGLNARQINRRQRKGLVIGNSFVGDVVEHPGARPHPFLAPAGDAREADAIQAVQDHIDRHGPAALERGTVSPGSEAA